MSKDQEFIEITIASIERMHEPHFAPARKLYPTEEKAAQIAHMRSSGGSVVFIFRPDGSMIDDSHVASVFGRHPMREQYLNLGDARAEHLHSQYQAFFQRKFIPDDHNLNTEAAVSVPFYAIINSTNGEVGVALVKDGVFDRSIERHAKEKNLPVFDSLDELHEKVLTDPKFKGKCLVFDEAGELSIDIAGEIDRFDVIISDLNAKQLGNLKRAYFSVFNTQLDMSEVGLPEDAEFVQESYTPPPSGFLGTSTSSSFSAPPSLGSENVRLLSAPRKDYGLDKEVQTALVLQNGQFNAVQYRAFESVPSDNDPRDTVWIGKRSDLVRFTSAGDVHLTPYSDAANRSLVELFSGKPDVVNAFKTAYVETFTRSVPTKSEAIVDQAFKGFVPQWS